MKVENLTMNQNRVLIRPDKAPDKIGGIDVLSSPDGKPKKATVLKVGPGITNHKGVRIPMQVKAGDRILYHPFSGNTITTDDGEKLLIITEDEIFMVVEG